MAGARPGHHVASNAVRTFYSCSRRFSSLDLLGERGVVADQALDLAHRVQHRGVVAAAEAPPDLGQRAQRQRLCQIHRDLARAHHIGGAARGQEIGAADIVLPRDDALDVLDLDALRLLRADQVAHRALGHVHGDRLAGQLVVREQAVERAVEIAAVVGDRLGDEGEDRRRHVEARVMRAGRRHAALEDFEPQFLFERAHLDHEPAGEARAHAVVEAFQIGRRTVGRDHHLTAGVDQRVERVAELDLGRLALQELQIVDHQHVDAAQRFLEGERGLRFQRRHEAVHEFLGGEIEHLALRPAVAGPGDRLQQMRLAEAHARVDVERVEHHRLAAPRQRDLLGRRMRERVGAADHEGVESQPRIERRAAERLVRGLRRQLRGAQRRRARRAALDLARGLDRLARLRLGGRRCAAPPSGGPDRCAAPKAVPPSSRRAACRHSATAPSS